MLRFRPLLETYQMTEALFAEIRGLLEEQRLLLLSHGEQGPPNWGNFNWRTYGE